MDVRGKLVELLREAPYNIFGNKLGNCYFDSCLALIADYLITNGVTVQEWISVDDRLPDQSGEVLVIVSGNPQKNITLDCAYELAEYDPYDGWIMEMWPEWEDAVVTHWMPLPLPPKGE